MVADLIETEKTNGYIPACMDHSAYIRWQRRNRCARKDQSLLFDLFNWQLIRSRVVTKQIFFSEKKPIFLHMCATYSEYHDEAN